LAVAAASVAAWTPASILALVVMAPCVLWIAGGAATAILGAARPAPEPGPPPGWQPITRTAVLITLCREPPGPVAARATALARALAAKGLESSISVVVLSDTFGAEAVAAEEHAFSEARDAGLIAYRRRARNTGAKPGNIAEWIAQDGTMVDFMVMLDADSRMSASRIARLIWRMERRPDLGLLQTGIAQVPAQTRFGAMQRTAVRLLSPGFGAGLARWAGDSGNYWGHNAIIRVSAFRDAALRLPVLAGRAPMGGPILSHDFVEAALLRRAGWAVALEPDLAGSAEEAPQTLEEFHRRDRRWCQGNLQHLRVLGMPGLDPISRLHMAAGIGGYIAAPAWLALLTLTGSGALAVASAWPIVLVGALLLVPKLVGLARYMRRATRWRMGVALRAAWGELALSALVTPLVMVRQSAAVAAVALGRDCGWKSTRRIRSLPRGLPEAAAGAGLAALTLAANPIAAPWLAPVVLPLLAAPLLIRWLEAPA
jgi:membrane glycosyltransferase